CRTGPGSSNIRIAEAARARGMKWNPYGCGFTHGAKTIVMTSEREVFTTVGLPYLAPEDRK
ncbi:MAG: DNA polymerase III, partial [Verrucomicrobiales bacterium]